MKRVKIACATDDGVNFSQEHLGSAKKFLIYEFDLLNGTVTPVGEVGNITPQEKTHGDPEKARSISELLGGVDVLFGFAFGPNMVRMRRKFVPILSKERNIKSALEKLKKRAEDLKSAIENKGVLIIE